MLMVRVRVVMMMRMVNENRNKAAAHLLGEGCEDPGELPAWESVLLDVQDLLSSGKSAIIAEQSKIQKKKNYSDMRPEECRQTCLAERSVVLTDRYPQALAFLGRDDLRFQSALISCCRCRRSGRSGHKSCIWRKTRPLSSSTDLILEWELTSCWLNDK